MPALVFPETPTEGELFPEVNPRWKYVSNRWTPYSVSVFDGGTIGQVWTKGADNTQAWDFVSGGGSAPGTPDAPTLVAATTTTLEVEVAPEDGATGYKWFLDTVFIASTSDPTYTFTGLTENTEYDITVSATNAYGESAQSTALVESTLSSVSYLLSDDMEYADASAAATAGWTNGGSPGWGYDTAPAPLQGSKSLHLAHSDDSSWKAFTATGEIWVYLIWRTSLRPTGILSIRNSSGTWQMIVDCQDTNGRFRIQWPGGSTITGNNVILADTTYHIWLRYKKGTGANGEVEAWVSTSATKPGSSTLLSTTTATTADVAQIQLYRSGTTGSVIADKLRIDDVEIGSNPS